MLKLLVVAFSIMVGMFFVLLIKELRHVTSLDDDEDNFPSFIEEEKKQWLNYKVGKYEDIGYKYFCEGKGRIFQKEFRNSKGR